ncbi:MAG: hypothetical protein WA366_23745 [Pseudolabrys sp.]
MAVFRAALFFAASGAVFLAAFGADVLVAFGVVAFGLAVFGVVAATMRPAKSRWLDLLGEVEIGIDDLGGSRELLGKPGVARELVGGLGPGGDRLDDGVLCIANRVQGLALNLLTDLLCLGSFLPPAS